MSRSLMRRSTRRCGAFFAAFGLLAGTAAMAMPPGRFTQDLFDQQWVAVKYDQLASTHGSTAKIRAFAVSELAMYHALAVKIMPLDADAGNRLLATLSNGQKHDSNNRPLFDDTGLLSGLSGDRFDKEYLLRVVLTHQRMIRHDLREIAARNGDPAVVKYAQKMLATLNDQTEAAGDLYSGAVNPPGPPPP